MFLKRDALVAEDEDEDEDDDESRRDPSADERAERVPSAASSASEGYGASGRVVERDERSPSRVRRLGDLNRRRRLEAARFVLDELRATLETGAGVYAFGGVGGNPATETETETETELETETERGGEARGEGGAFARRRPGDGDDVYDASRLGRARRRRAAAAGDPELHARAGRDADAHEGQGPAADPERRRAVGRAETLLKTDETESTESTESTERYGEVRARFA